MKPVPTLCSAMLVLLLFPQLDEALGFDVKQEPSTKGGWRGCSPGAWVVMKRIYRGQRWRTDGVEYNKRLLYGTGDRGNGWYTVYKSDKADGPWKKTKHGGSSPDWLDETDKMLVQKGDDKVAINDVVVACDVYERTTESWDGTTVMRRWYDPKTHLVLRSRNVFTARFKDVARASRTTDLNTRWIRQELRQGKRIRLYDQVHISKSDGETWQIMHRTVSPDIPGREVNQKVWNAATTNDPPNYESQLIDWGEDKALLAKYLAEMPNSELQRKKQEEENRARLQEVYAKNIQQLSSLDEQRKIHATQFLAQNLYLRDEETKAAITEALRPCLNDPAPTVRRNAARGLGNLGAKDVIPRIVELLKTDREGTWYYIQALIALDALDITPVILEAAKYKQPMARRSAVQALKQIDSKEARDAIVGLTADPYYGVRREAYEALGAFGTPDLADAILKGMSDTNRHVRSAAMHAAGKVGGDALTSALIKSLSANEKREKQAACAALCEMKDLPDEAIDAFVKLIDSDDRQMKVYAIAVLGKLKRREIVPKLVKIVQEAEGLDSQKKNAWMLSDAMMAFRALQQIGDQRAVPGLLPLLDNPHKRDMALATLREIGGPSVAREFFTRYKAVPVKSEKSGDVGADRDERRRIRELLRGIGGFGDEALLLELQKYFKACPPAKRRDIWSAMESIKKRLAEGKQ